MTKLETEENLLSLIPADSKKADQPNAWIRVPHTAGAMEDLRAKVHIDLSRNFGVTLRNNNVLKWLIADFFYVQLIITPIYVMTWRGTWENFDDLFDQVIFHGDKKTSTYVAFLIGILTNFLTILLQHKIRDFANQHRGCLYFAISRLFTIFRFYCDLLIWKGIWGFFLYILGDSKDHSIAAMVIGLSTLFLTQSLRSSTCPPFGMRTDVTSNYISIPTAFSVQPSSPFLHRVGDLLFSLFLSLSSMVTFFGIWSTQDFYFKNSVPDVKEEELGGIMAALGIGYCCCILVFVFQFLSLFLHPVNRTVISDFRSFGSVINMLFYELILVIAVIGSVTVFRAQFFLCDKFILPSNTFWSRILCQVFGLALMFLLFCGSTLQGGVHMEKYRQKHGILIPNFFLTHLTSKEVVEDDGDGEEEEGAAVEADRKSVV